MPDIPPAWHPDPTGKHDHRWWDGQRWTEHVADAGVAAVDPLPAAPASGGQAATGGAAGSAAAVAGTSDGTATDGGSAAAAGGTASGATGAEAATGADTSAATGGDQPAWGGGAPRTDAAAGAWSSDAATTGQPAQQSAQRPGQQPAWPGTEGGGGGAAAWEGQGWGSTGPAPATGDPNKTPGMAIAALALGLLSIPSAIVLIGGLFGLVGIILGAVASGKAKRGETGGRGIAIGGIITGSIGLLIAIVLFITVFAGIATDIQACIDETGDPEQCEEELQRDLMDRFG